MAAVVCKPFIIFGRGEQEYPSNDTLDSLLRTPLLPQTCPLVCVGKEMVACLSIKGKEEFMEALGKHFSTVR